MHGAKGARGHRGKPKTTTMLRGRTQCLPPSKAATWPEYHARSPGQYTRRRRPISRSPSCCRRACSSCCTAATCAAAAAASRPCSGWDSSPSCCRSAWQRASTSSSSAVAAAAAAGSGLRLWRRQPGREGVLLCGTLLVGGLARHLHGVTHVISPLPACLQPRCLPFATKSPTQAFVPAWCSAQ
jgi:hypothetical protein